MSVTCKSKKAKLMILLFGLVITVLTGSKLAVYFTGSTEAEVIEITDSHMKTSGKRHNKHYITTYKVKYLKDNHEIVNTVTLDFKTDIEYEPGETIKVDVLKDNTLVQHTTIMQDFWVVVLMLIGLFCCYIGIVAKVYMENNE